MAELRKIVPRPARSTYVNEAAEAGGVFRLMAEAANTAYERLRPAAIEEQARLGQAEGQAYGRQQVGNPSDVRFGPNDDTLTLIRGFEGFREAPYWDVNAHRVGYGSDTITLADGTVRRVTEADRVTRADADRDLQRRVTNEFEPIVANAIGADVFAGLAGGQRAVLTSIAYNYGELPDSVAAPVRAGDMAGATEAIRALGVHNNGVNANRREREAGIFASSTGSGTTVVRTSEGKLEARLYSPLAGEILQAHDAAFGVAYTAQVMLDGSTEMQALSDRFLLDPEGYKQAAQGYVDEIVSAAPDRFRSDIRVALETEMTQRYLGVMEDKQRDIRQRADNSSAALVEKWAANLTDAMVAGNPAEISAARTQLDSLLAAREALPGVSWTREQSDEVLRQSADRARTETERIREEARKADSAKVEGQLDTIIAAAEAGLRGADEAILSDPAVQAANPDLWSKAIGAVTLRDWLPSFRSSTPQQQAAAIASARSGDITSDLELSAIKAMEDVNRATVKAWTEDPIAQANAVLPRKPPPLPDMATATPETVQSALAARRTYAHSLVDGGYTKTPAFLSNEEAVMLGALMGKDVDPAARSMLASTIVKGFGQDAGAVFREIKSDDPITRYSGMMIAAGGNPNAATTAMRGQQMLDEGLVKPPTRLNGLISVDSGAAQAVAALPGAIQAEADIMAYATAIYAANAAGVDPASAKAKEVMAAAVQTALGQETTRGRLTGGVQDIGGFPTILPIGVAGEDVMAGIGLALGSSSAQAWTGFSWFTGAATEARTDLWGGKVPTLGGEPVKPYMWEKGFLQMVPVNGTVYRLVAAPNGVSTSDIRDENGAIFTFDIRKLADAGLAGR